MSTRGNGEGLPGHDKRLPNARGIFPARSLQRPLTKHALVTPGLASFQAPPVRSAFSRSLARSLAACVSEIANASPGSDVSPHRGARAVTFKTYVTLHVSVTMTIRSRALLLPRNTARRRSTPTCDPRSQNRTCQFHWTK